MSQWRFEATYALAIFELTALVWLYFDGWISVTLLLSILAYLALALPLACVVGRRLRNLSESSQAADPPHELLPDSAPTGGILGPPRTPAANGAEVGATGMSHRAGNGRPAPHPRTRA